MNRSDIFCTLNRSQKSPEWLEARKGKMGGTSANDIGEHNEYSHALDVYLDLIRSCEKCMMPDCEHYDAIELQRQEDMKTNVHVKRGNDMEASMRDLTARKIDVPFIADGKMAWHAIRPHIRDSCDGFTWWRNPFTPHAPFTPVTVEIKCPQMQTPHVPPWYMPQIQLHMYVNDTQQCIYASYHKEGSRWWCVDRNEKYLKWLLNRLDLVFWCACNDKPELLTGAGLDQDWFESYKAIFDTYKGFKITWDENKGEPFNLDELGPFIHPMK